MIAFLVSNCRYSPQVGTAVVLALAAGGVLRSQPDPDGVLAIGVAAAAPPSGRPLLPFEQLTVDRVRSRAAGRGAVPLPVLLSDDGDDFTQWRKELTDALGSQARQAGLARRSPGRTVCCVLLALALAGGLAVIIASQVSHQAGHAAVVSGDVLGIALVAPLLLIRWRPTPAGVAAARRYRQQGVRPAAATPGMPLPKGQAWSCSGGSWHPVCVGRLQAPPRWSTLWPLLPLGFYMAAGTVVSSAIGLAADHNHAQGLLIGAAPAAAGGMVILGLWLPAYARRMSLPDRASYTGEIVKRWKVTDSEEPDRYYLCVDDGISAAGHSYQVTDDQYHRIAVGELAEVTYSPRWRRLVEILPVTHGAATP